MLGVTPPQDKSWQSSMRSAPPLSAAIACSRDPTQISMRTGLAMDIGCLSSIARSENGLMLSFCSHKRRYHDLHVLECSVPRGQNSNLYGARLFMRISKVLLPAFLFSSMLFSQN